VTAGALQRRPAEPQGRAAGTNDEDEAEGERGDDQRDEALEDVRADDEGDDNERSRLPATSIVDFVCALTASERFARGAAPANETPTSSAPPARKTSLLRIAIPHGLVPPPGPN
jgi:hypothetical protein